MSKNNVILIKYGEIGLKGKNRPFFERALRENIARALNSKMKDVVSQRGRLYVPLHSPSLKGEQEGVERRGVEERLLHNLSRVFGIVSFAEAVQLPHEHDLEQIKDAAMPLLEKTLTEGGQTPLSFKIDAHRANKHFPIDSMEINKQIGAFVLERFPHLAVDLGNPDVALHIEVREEGIFLYTSADEHAGPGGLPVGVSGRGLLLLSGGIDSPVAGWMMLKRGMAVDAVYFDSPPYTGARAKEKVRDLARILAEWKLKEVRLYVPYFTDIMVAINKQCPEPAWTVLHRRFMMRVAEYIANSEQRIANSAETSYNALVTGENLAQVASQTIENIAVIQKTSSLPVLRPLIGFDKQEIVDIAKRIGTYRISTLPYEDCCTVFAPAHPHTKVREEDIIKAEEVLDVEGLVRGAVERMEVIKITM